MSFYVGQKVVCVDDSSPPLNVLNGCKIPVKSGKIYTIKAAYYGYKSTPVVDLCEVPHCPHCGAPSAFQALRFRPLQERSTETGMAILRKVADDASKKRVLCGND